MNATDTTSGIGASPGIALGLAYVIAPTRARAQRIALRGEEIEPEVERFRQALAQSDQQLEDLKTRITRPERENNEHILILEAHRMFLHDPMLVDQVTRLIREDAVNAGWAVRRIGRRIRRQFRDLDDEYFRERRSDIEFVIDRILRNLLGEEVDSQLNPPDGAVVVCQELSPADAAVLARSNHIGGFIVESSGKTSHAIIIARSQGIPAVVGVPRVTELIRSGDLLAIDGESGTIAINPSALQRQDFERLARRRAASGGEARKVLAYPALTTDGHLVRLQGNIDFPEEVPLLLKNGGEGVGLYRTEYLFANSTASEDEQFERYRQVLVALEGLPVTIRTFDLGGDKPASRQAEMGSSLGLRAIRYSLKNRELFRVQLRALLRASVYGNLRVMFPLISSMNELREARAEFEACRTDLTTRGIPTSKDIPIGIMVETPSAVWIADRLASESDFFSIGTNDLIQYTIAIDRQDREVAHLYRPLHLSILRSLQAIVKAAADARIPVAMCGEMAGDPQLTLVLLALGLEELSMSSRQIPQVKSMIRQVSHADGQALLKEALDLTSTEDIEHHYARAFQERFPSEAKSLLQ